MLTCRTKTGPGWKVTCGKEATHIEVVELRGDAWAFVSCDEHHNSSAVAISNQSPDELRKVCEAAGVEPGF
jgi:hypothetical protein